MSLVILSSIVAFISTEMDDLITLLMLFSQAKSLKEKIAIIVGKYLGLALLIIGSAFFSYYISGIPSYWLSLLGIVPVAFGVKYIIDSKKNDAKGLDGVNKNNSNSSFLIMTGLSFIMSLASGGDNIAIYISFFTSLNGFSELFVSILIFALMQGLWFLLIWILMSFESLKVYIEKGRQVIIPVLFIVLGIYIFIKNGSSFAGSWKIDSFVK